MRYASAYLLACFVLTVGATGSVEPKVVRLYGDLDLDGRVDTVTVTFFPERLREYNHYRVQIGGAIYDGRGEALHGEATIVDIDSTDAFLEIAVPQWGPSDDDAVFFLRYVKGRVRLIGEVPGAKLVIDGSGKIRTKCVGQILCTWFYPCTFKWLPEAQVLAEQPQAFKPMRIKVTLKHDLQLSSQPVKWQSSTTLKAGTRATIDLTDDKLWLHIRSSQGSGWFFINGLRIYPSEIENQEMFDGLLMAD